jgi:hypothetical protein
LLNSTDRLTAFCALGKTEFATALYCPFTIPVHHSRSQAGRSNMSGLQTVWYLVLIGTLAITPVLMLTGNL